MRQITVIAHNIRSTHNVGSILRTAEGMGVVKVYFTGYSPYPLSANDSRLPHISNKLNSQIIKTALGAEKHIKWEHSSDVFEVVRKLQADGMTIIGLEQDPKSTKLSDFKVPDNLVLIIGNEVDGLQADIMSICDHLVEIPMFGKKESFNVVQAFAIALYHMRFY